VSLDPNKFSLHVHFPEGAVPKDGPSAGIAIFTSLMSLLTQKSVLPRLSMTGELTLRGSVNPVGGIKEKVIAAHRAGLTAVILPEKNRRDLKDIPDEVKQTLEIHFVSRIEEVIRLAFGFEVPSLGPKLLTVFPTEDRGSASSSS
jgi:ATP-dependent Lon protease